MCVFLMSLPATTFAQQPAGAMEKNRQPMYSSSPKINRNTDESKHCTELAKRVEALKGKPQQRYAASERYKQECATGN
jgi:hypothetical protein